MRKSEHSELSDIHSELINAVPKIYMNASGDFVNFDNKGKMKAVSNDEVLQMFRPLQESVNKLGVYLKSIKPK